MAGLNQSVPVNEKCTLDFKDLRTTEHKLSLIMFSDIDYMFEIMGYN